MDGAQKKVRYFCSKILKIQEILDTDFPTDNCWRASWACSLTMLLPLDAGHHAIKDQTEDIPYCEKHLRVRR